MRFGPQLPYRVVLPAAFFVVFKPLSRPASSSQRVAIYVEPRMWGTSTQQHRDGWDSLPSPGPGAGLNARPAAGWGGSSHPPMPAAPNPRPQAPYQAHQGPHPPPEYPTVPSKKPKTAAAPCTVSLQRYLDLMQLMTGSVGGAVAQPVRRLTKLEAGALTLGDLKAILQLHGAGGPGPRSKQEIVEQMEGMLLSTPICIMDDLAMGDPGAGATAPPAVLDEAILEALGWVAPQGGVVDAALAQQGFYSFCALPRIEVRGLRQALPPPQVAEDANMPAGEAPVAPARPTDSQATEASRPGLPRTCVQDSPASLGHALGGGGTEQSQAEATQPTGSTCVDPHAVPRWLAEGLARVAATSQASQEAVEGRQLVGRKVLLVLAEGFEQGGGDGVVDSLLPGIHVGQVVEYIGSYHDPDACPPSCAQRHAFYYVRLPPSSSTAARARWGRRRLDLATDLQAALRVLGLDVLPELERSMLADAWALLEPREDAE